MTAEKRRIRVNAANLRNSHLYVTGLGDFFPKDAIGVDFPERGNQVFPWRGPGGNEPNAGTGAFFEWRVAGVAGDGGIVAY